jgi:hypothetical protein
MQDHGSAIRISSSAADRPRPVVMLQLGRAKSVLITQAKNSPQLTASQKMSAQQDRS